MTKTVSAAYVECSRESVPAAVRFDIPRRNQGQAIEVAYGGFDRSEHDDGAPYKRVVDHGEGPDARKYYRLAGKVR